VAWSAYADAGRFDAICVCDLPLGDMIRKPDMKQPFPPLKPLPGLPTEPGWYWWKGDEQSRENMVRVRLTNGELTAWWLNEDTPVADMKGRWRGPIPPFPEPDNPTAS